MSPTVVLKNRYEGQKEEITKVHNNFKGLLLRLRNMCSTDEKILRDISEMLQELTARKNKITKFDENVRDLCQNLIVTQTECKRKIKENKAEMRRYHSNLEARREKMRENEKEKDELHDQQHEEEERLRQLQRKNERHNEETKNCVKAQWTLVGATAGLGALAVIFPPVGVPALIAAGGTAAGSLTAGVIGIIEQAQKASQEKLNSLRGNISNVGRQLDQLKEEIEKDEEWAQWYWKQIYETNHELDKAKRHIAKCRMMQENGNIWVEQLGAWIDFLIRITPEAKRIQGNIGGNPRSLQRSIDDFKGQFNGELKTQIDGCARILAIQNRSANRYSESSSENSNEDTDSSDNSEIDSNSSNSSQPDSNTASNASSSNSSDTSDDSSDDSSQSSSVSSCESSNDSNDSSSDEE